MTCKVSKGTLNYYYIASQPNTYVDLDNLSVQSTREIVNRTLGKFDLTIIEKSGVYSAGMIISITVDGNPNYTPGEYPETAKVVVTIDND